MRADSIKMFVGPRGIIENFIGMKAGVTDAFNAKLASDFKNRIVGIIKP